MNNSKKKKLSQHLMKMTLYPSTLLINQNRNYKICLNTKKYHTFGNCVREQNVDTVWYIFM